jgi:hypothetical protein
MQVGALRAPGVAMPMLLNVGCFRMETEAYSGRAAGVLAANAKSGPQGLVSGSHCGNRKLPVDKPPE